MSGHLCDERKEHAGNRPGPHPSRSGCDSGGPLLSEIRKLPLGRYPVGFRSSRAGADVALVGEHSAGPDRRVQSFPAPGLYPFMGGRATSSPGMGTGLAHPGGMHPGAGRSVSFFRLTFFRRPCIMIVACKPNTWGCSSAGRAPRSQRGGRRFDPAQLHQPKPLISRVFLFVGGRILSDGQALRPISDCLNPPAEGMMNVSGLCKTGAGALRRRFKRKVAKGRIQNHAGRTTV